MGLELQIIVAFLLDQLLGDPRQLPHPVKFIGRFALFVEKILRKVISTEKGAGIVTVLLVLSATGGTVALLLYWAGKIFWLAELLAVYLLYTALAAKDLAEHSKKVHAALAAADLARARTQVAMIVGRDSAALDEEGVGRACIESVAENLVDGVTAPLFWAAVAGPVGALLYKAVNTMDSLFGYKNEKYINFGWAAARLDDLANWLPARLTALVLIAAAFLLRLDGPRAYRVWRRDRKKHASPNSGQTEAAVAGALGVELGGANFYFGRLVEKPTLGEALKKIEANDILRANRLMLASAILTGLLFLAMRGLLY
jgi:adenosylcobinamide-phosphate synthase